MQDQTESRRDRRRRGPRRQRRARQAERTARRSAVAFARWLECHGETRSASARRLALSLSALSRWMRRWKEDRMTLRPRGRPVEDLDRETRADILGVFSLMGPHASLAALRDLFPQVARAELDHLLERCRSVYRRRRRWLVHTLRWTRPGTVWAMDFTEPPAPIDGQYRYLLLVRDLASGRQMLAMPCEGEGARVVVDALRMLFEHEGRPLVIKMDNGSAFLSWEVGTLLREHRVFALFSPPGTPAYNGSVEAGIGSLEVRAFYQSARHDRTGQWTCDDVAAARRQANDTAHPWGLGGPTPEAAWEARTPITENDARLFRSAYDHHRERECAERQIPSWKLRSHWLRASIDRVALSRALIERGYLLIRSRRVTPPITLHYAGRIS
ncbi:MAG TPA: DDE-type integrase/transposase/recombinase [bacterium]|nr:DDE-type integrase/transposase/recombinase [bacterium]